MESKQSKQSSIMSIYVTWEQTKLKEYDVFVSKYATIKEQENATTEHTMSKKEYREQLYNQKEGSILSDEDAIFKSLCEAEDAIETRFSKHHVEFQDKKERVIRDAQQEMDDAIVKAKKDMDDAIEKAQKKFEKAGRHAESDYDKTMTYYKDEKENSLARASRQYKEKKSKLARQTNKIEIERKSTIKTPAQLTLEKQKRAVLKEMKNIIDVINMTRNTLSEKNPVFIFDVPELPEPLTDEYIPPIAQAPVKPPRPFPSEAQWMASGEDAENQELRKMELAKQRNKIAQHPDRPDVITRYGDISDLEGRESTPAYYLMNMIPPNQDAETLPEVQEEQEEQEEQEQEEQEDDDCDWSEPDEEYINARKNEMKSLLKVRNQ